jgi:hypothetical protein
MVLKIRLISFAAILAAACLFAVAMVGISDIGEHFVGLALIAVLAGGICLTKGLALAGFKNPGNSSFGAA